MSRVGRLDDYVFNLMTNMEKWTFWSLQSAIKEKHGRFFGEPTISQAIRNIRKDYMRERHNLPYDIEVVLREKLESGNGCSYQLAPEILKHWEKTNGI